LSLTQSSGTATDTMEILSAVYGGNTYLNSKSGWLGLMKWFEAGEAGTFRAEVTTEASISNPVPLPGAFLLFGPGLACIAVFRRRLTRI
jgi:hypothetical protein